MIKLYALPIILQIAGILIIATEIFVPSLGVLTIISVCLFFYSIYFVFENISSSAGIILIGLDIVFIPIIIIFGMKMLSRSPLALKKKLSKKEGVTAQNKELENYMNMEGISITNLRPAGVAIINKNRLDVVANGEYIEIDKPIIVTKITGNQIIVEQQN